MSTPATDPAYGFRDRLHAEFPSQVIMAITEVCNLACTHCPHPEFKRSARYGARYLEPELNAKMVDEVREHGAGHVQYIRYTAEGEPLVHPGAYDMIEYAARHSGTFVTITTNGTIMNERRTRRLLDSGVQMIDISIDAYRPETYARIRVGGDLEVTRANVLNLLRWVREAGGGTRVVVSYVEQPENQAETREFETYWREQGADSVVVRRLHSAAGAVPGLVQIVRLAGKGEARYPCLYPWERVLINPRGQVSFCPQDWVGGSAVADFRTTSIRETWQAETYRRLREAHLRNDFSGHAFCGNCPDWRQTRWPGQGRSYADLVGEFAPSPR